MYRGGAGVGILERNPRRIRRERSEHCSQGNHLYGDQELDLSPIMQRNKMKRGVCLGQGYMTFMEDSQQRHTSKWNTRSEQIEYKPCSKSNTIFSFRFKKTKNMQMKIIYNGPGRF